MRHWLLLPLLLCGLLVGCGDSSSGTTQPAAKVFKIGLIVSGSTADGGWNRAARLAIEDLTKQPGYRLAVAEKVDPSKAGNEMRSFAADGFDLVIGHGYEFAVPAREAAGTLGAAGKTKFLVSGYPLSEPGIMTLDFDLAQSCYQLGIIAASVSQSNKIGFIGGSEIPSLVACFKGFEAGAKSVKPDIVVVKAYTSWDMPELSKSQTEAFIQQNVDVILQNVDAASRGVFEAVHEWNAKSGSTNHVPGTVWVFGTNSNQNDNIICPEYTLASAVIRLDKAFANVVKSIQDGTFTPGVQTENIANGICVTEVNPKLVERGVISKDVLAKVQEAGAKLASGELKLP
jgi:basic membrane lipoprotein Med (substrate-binding protein (PBP1-ABC) superfamily)